MLGKLFGNAQNAEKKRKESYPSPTSPSQAITPKMDIRQLMEVQRTQSDYREYLKDRLKQQIYAEAEFYFHEKFRDIINKQECRINELEVELAIERELNADLFNFNEAGRFIKPTTGGEEG